MTYRQFFSGVLLVLACGGKDDLDSGVPEAKTGSELMAAEQDSLCDAIGDYYKERVSAADFAGYLCTLDGIGEGTDVEGDTAAKVAACEQARSDCASDPDNTVTEVMGCRDELDWTMCGASVAEIERCVQDSVDRLAGLIDDFDCNLLDPARAMEIQQKYGDSINDPFPPSCDVIKAKCPALLGGSGDDDEGEDEGEEF